MKTILVNIFDTAVVKNILVPQFLATLTRAASEIRVIVTVPEHKFDEFARDYAHPLLHFVPRPKQNASTMEAAVLFIVRNSIPTHSERYLQEIGFDGSGRLPVIRYWLARILWVVGHVGIFRRLLKKIVTPVFDTRIFDDILSMYHPNLIFATTIYSVDDVRLMRAAKRHRIPTIGMIKSWDNLTCKDAILIPPDTLITHNDVMKEEAVTLHGYPRRDVVVVGIPQFDWYADPQFPYAKEAFFSRLRLDPQKKLITYTAAGLSFFHRERDVIAVLDRIIREGTIDMPAQLLVRMHPAYPDEKEILIQHFPRVIFDEPGQPVRDTPSAWKADWKFNANDVRHLAATLKHSDVTLNCGSTMILEAACFDTPIIGIAFDGESIEPNYWQSARSFFKKNHLRKIVETGGIQLVHSERELVAALNEYLKHPAKDRDGRARIVAEQIGEVGHAGTRIAQTILSAVGI